ncbi:hypothetical protein CYMTET_19281 [Cymbomonas tetramitiformis]|uniref:Zinc finger CCCH-type with G patch domain-containing protein n=1 Tax=Cymbomonas tetramitiformis TaxID=36881 RepID=A0AAE0G6C3_9CHLO|nr:hypothetical protein CYMTET_19281 [Cymbomonas tetramitiformis]
MADSDVLESELQEELDTHEATLKDIDEALAEESNEELEMLREELLTAVEGAKAALLEIKQARLLSMLDGIGAATAAASSVDKGQPATEAAAEEQEEVFELRKRWQAPGVDCRFRHTDGRWYHGTIMELQTEAGGSESAVVAYARPSQRSMQMCRFQMLGRCRFGDACRSSHGEKVSLDALLPAKEAAAVGLEEGSRVVACDGMLWRPAEIERMDLQAGTVAVAFLDGSDRAEVPSKDVAESLYADVGDSSDVDEGSRASSDSEEDEEDEENAAVATLQQGAPEDDVAKFADWEQHTNQVASRIMAKFGFVQGGGLGKRGQGVKAPLLVQLRNQGKGLGADARDEGGGLRERAQRKKKRGGERSRRKKFAAQSKAQREQAHVEAEKVAHANGTAGMFGLLNSMEAPASKPGTGEQQGQPHAKHRRVAAPPQDKSKGGAKAGIPGGRTSMMEGMNKVMELQAALKRLGEMMTRHSSCPP